MPSPVADYHADFVQGIGEAGNPHGSGILSVQGVAGATAQPVDTELPAAVALSDVLGNPTVPGVGAYEMVWNSASNQWERARAVASGNINQPGTGIPARGQYVFNPVNGWDAVREGTGDGLGVAGFPGQVPMLFNPNTTAYERARSAQITAAAVPGTGLSPSALFGYDVGTGLWSRKGPPVGDGLPIDQFIGVIPMLFDGFTGLFDRVRMPAGDAQILGIPGSLVMAQNLAGSYDRMRGSAQLGLRTDVYVDGSSLTVAGTPNAIATATLPAAGAGLFHYIDSIRCVRIATAAVAGGAILAITTVNLNNRQWRTGNLIAAGDTEFDVDEQYTRPVRSLVANTNTQIICPAAGAACSWDIVIEYHVGP